MYLPSLESVTDLGKIFCVSTIILCLHLCALKHFPARKIKKKRKTPRPHSYKTFLLLLFPYHLQQLWQLCVSPKFSFARVKQGRVIARVRIALVFYVSVQCRSKFVPSEFACPIHTTGGTVARMDQTERNLTEIGFSNDTWCSSYISLFYNTVLLSQCRFVFMVIFGRARAFCFPAKGLYLV